jgi:LysM domain
MPSIMSNKLNRKSVKSRFLSGFLACVYFFAANSVSQASVCAPLSPIENSEVEFNGESYYLSANFEPRPDRTVHIDIQIEKRIPEIWDQYSWTVKSNIPANACGTDASLNSISLGNSGDIGLEGRANVTVHKWLCIKTKVPCFRGIKWYSCDWIIRESDLGFQKTVDIVTNFTPALMDAEGKTKDTNQQPLTRAPFLKVTGTSNIEGFSDLEQFFINLFQFAGELVKIGSIGVIDLTKEIEQLQPSFDPFVHDVWDSIGQDNFKPQYYDVRLRNEGGNYLLRAKADDTRLCSIAEQVHQYLIESIKVRQKESVGETSHIVSAGETLWSITNDEYGSGYHYINVASWNSLRAPFALRVGDKIVLPSLSQMQSGGIGLVKKDDSLWSMSTELKFDIVAKLKKYRDVGRNPNLIYPGEIVPNF